MTTETVQTEKQRKKALLLMTRAPRLVSVLKEVLAELADSVDVADGEEGPMPNRAMRLTAAIEFELRMIGEEI